LSSLERVVERLVEVRFVECPYCDLRVMVKNPSWKRVTCKGCGHKINVPFSKGMHVEERVVYERVKVRSTFDGIPIPAIKEAK